LSDTNAVPAGRMSLQFTPVAADGPPLLTVIEYANATPGVALAGPIFTIDRSACVLIVVLALDELLLGSESKDSDVAVAVLVRSVPFGVDGETATVTVNWALCPFPRKGIVQETVCPPTHIAAGPLFCRTETNVSCDGSASVNEGFVAVSGPPFESTIVYDIVPPAVAVAGALFITPMLLEETVTVVAALSFSALGSLLVV